jgi:threonine/homoserine/homoserine lactone efflux protein
MDRIMFLWIVVVVLAMGVAFAVIRQVTASWDPDITRELQISSGILLIGVLVAVVRRRR